MESRPDVRLDLDQIQSAGNRESYEILERMHSPPAHGEAVRPKDRRDCDGTALPEPTAPAAACGLLAPDPAFQDLDTADLLTRPTGASSPSAR
jgi:hypothetical protein